MSVELSRSELVSQVQHYDSRWQMQMAITDLLRSNVQGDDSQFARDMLATSEEALRLFADRRDAFKSELDRRFPRAIQGFTR